MISCRANIKRQSLQRNLRTCNRYIKLQCYKTYVRPIIEYVSPVWDTNNKNVTQKVESVQRKAAKFILNDYNKDSSVSKMIKKLNLDSIELRRKVKKLKLMHSIASQKTFLSNAIKPAYGRKLVLWHLIRSCTRPIICSIIHSLGIPYRTMSSGDIYSNVKLWMTSSCICCLDFLSFDSYILI